MPMAPTQKGRHHTREAHSPYKTRTLTETSSATKPGTSTTSSSPGCYKKGFSLKNSAGRSPGTRLRAHTATSLPLGNRTVFSPAGGCAACSLLSRRGASTQPGFARLAPPWGARMPFPDHTYGDRPYIDPPPTAACLYTSPRCSIWPTLPPSPSASPASSPLYLASLRLTKEYADLLPSSASQGSNHSVACPFAVWKAVTRWGGQPPNENQQAHGKRTPRGL